jgi:hypothetical protein
MDLRMYYQKIREVEEKLADPVVMVSLETADGGKAGMRTEVPKRVAAKLVVEGRARVADEDEARAFHEAVAEAKQNADQLADASRMQWVVVAPTESRNPKGTGRSGKD